MTNADKATEKLQGILNEEEYQVYYEDHRGFLEVWWDRFLHWLGELLSRLFPSFTPSSGFANVVLFLVIAVVIVLIVLFVFLGIRKRKQNTSISDYAPLKEKMERRWTYESHFHEARTQEESENYTEATRHYFLAVLLYFHEKGVLKAGDGKTNWEYVAEIKQVNKQYAEMFYDLAVTFDEVVYGQHILQRHEYMQFRDDAIKLYDANIHTNSAGPKGV